MVCVDLYGWIGESGIFVIIEELDCVRAVYDVRAVYGRDDREFLREIRRVDVSAGWVLRVPSTVVCSSVAPSPARLL